MITELDIKEIDGIKAILNEKLNKEFNWDIANKIECLDRLVKNLGILPLSFKYAPLNSNFYTVDCLKCGWWGSSELLDGGNQIADTGDYSDGYCPICGGSSDLDDKENYLFEDYIKLSFVDIKNPNFSNNNNPYEWVHYVPYKWQNNWDELSEREQQIVSVMGQMQADSYYEENGRNNKK